MTLDQKSRGPESCWFLTKVVKRCSNVFYLNQMIILFEKLIRLTLLSRIPWLTVSNAFLRSKKYRQHALLPQSFHISLSGNGNHRTDEWLPLKLRLCIQKTILAYKVSCLIVENFPNDIYKQWHYWSITEAICLFFQKKFYVCKHDILK